MKLFNCILKKLVGVHCPSKTKLPSPIKLDVGGQIYKTRLKTLQIDPDSLPALMFLGGSEPEKDSDGALTLSTEMGGIFVIF